MSQKTDNLIKLALVFFVSLLSFSIGTYVGKKYSDNQHKLALLEPKKDNLETQLVANEFATDNSQIEPHANTALPTTNSTELMTGIDEKTSALTDSEVAKIAEEFANEDEEEIGEDKMIGSIESDVKPVGKTTHTVKAIDTPTKLVAQAKPTPNQASAPTTAVVKPVVTAPKPIAQVDKSVDTTETVKPTPTDAADSRERVPASIPPKQEITPIHYTVQIGSFPTQDEAEKLTKSLQNKGYKTSYVPATVNGQTWFRVNVGLFGTVREAQDYKKEFLEKTQFTSAIVQRLQH